MPYSDNPISKQSRRSFIRKGTLGLALTPLLKWEDCGGLPDPRSSLPLVPDDEKLGMALVGMGRYSTGQLAPALEETTLCKLSAIVTGTPSKAAEWQERHPHLRGHVYDYENFDSIADDDAVDIIYVVLPNSMHAEYTIRAAQAGKHVICEKPMAISVSECKEMIDACDAAGVKLSIGYRLHFEPHNLEAMRIGQEKVFGKVKYLQTSFGFRTGNWDNWRFDRELAGGGALMDVGIYAVQAARYVTGEEPIRVTAQEVKTQPEQFAEVDETVTWQLVFPSGAIATSATSYAARMERLYAACEEGWIELRPAYVYSGIAGRTSQGEMNFSQVNQQAAQMDAFADCVINDRQSTVDGYEGLRDMRVIEAIYESVRTGAAVDIAP